MNSFVSLNYRRIWISVFAMTLVLSPSGWAQKATRKLTGDESGNLQLEAARKNPLQLRHFLQQMPKGADLHYHLTGGVYAETFIRDGVEDGLCIDIKIPAFIKCSAEMSKDVECAESWKTDEIVPARAAYCQQHLYDAMVDAFSMRGFVPYAGVTNHDHFFDSFGKFAALKATHRAEWVDEVARRAATQNEQYMELMFTPDFHLASKLATEIPWTEDFPKLREEFLAQGLLENVKSAVDEYRETERKRRELEKCDQPKREDACRVDVRYLYQVLRGLPQEVVFAQALLAFEAAQAAPELVVGLNFVMPEDGYVPMRDYDLHMRMVKYLHGVYPNVHIALHAGEITYEMVPPDGLCCHVRKAVEAGAERIGHGVDVLYEQQPHQLMREMAAKHVMVEINLTSNAVILGVSGMDHPFPMYRQFGVPMALSTDDEGVSRIDLTNEYVRAVETYGLSYADLKKMARTGLEHAFLPGNSLWMEKDSFSKFAIDCAKDSPVRDAKSKSCETFLNMNVKAKAQWELERRFVEFEATF